MRGKTNLKANSFAGKAPDNDSGQQDGKQGGTRRAQETTVLKLSPREHGRGFGDEEIVPLGDREATTMIQHRGFCQEPPLKGS